MKTIIMTLSILISSSLVQSNPLDRFVIGVGTSIGVVSGATFTSIPVGATVVLTTPYGFNLGPLKYTISLAFGSYSGKYDAAEDDTYSGEAQWVDEFNPTVIALGGNLTLAEFLFSEGHVGTIGEGLGFRGFAGVSLERLMSGGLNLPVNILLGSELFISQDMSGSGNASGWISLGARLDYHIGDKRNHQTIGSGPSASVSGQAKGGVIEQPGSTGSPEIDNFVTATFDLNDKIVDLKEKVESVSSGLSESNKVLTAIGGSSSGPVGWALKELTKGFSKSKNSITSAVESLKSEVPDLPEIYFNLIKESMTDPNTLQELLKGTEPEEALVLTFNKKAKEKGVPTTSKDWVKSLNLELDPTKALKTKLVKINDGVMGGKDKLVSIPDDLKAIGEQAQSLLGSAKELPKAAKSLGFSKAPAALKAIKATTGVLKNIPNEVTAIGDETKKVAEEIEEVLNNIKNIIS